MGEKSGINWTDHTYNEWKGCTQVGPGCDHCYAKGWGLRYGVAWGPGQPRSRASESTRKLPHRWNRRAARNGVREVVFGGSLMDVLDHEVTQQWRDDLFRTIEETPWLDWVLLTKRIGNAKGMLPKRWLAKPPDNVWPGATICNQAEADRDAGKLLELAGMGWKVWLSIEPLIGPVVIPEELLGMLSGIVVGGESGPKARPMHPDWPRVLQDQCETAGVAFFFKGWGEYRYWRDIAEGYSNRTAYRPGYGSGLNWKGGFWGETINPKQPEFAGTFRIVDPGGENASVRVGKKTAGRELNGKLHDDLPWRAKS